MLTVYMEMKQIEKEYDGQWVFLVNCNQNQNGSILGGEVALHSKDRGSVVSGMNEADNKTSLTFIGYVGKIPEGVALL